jgi:hypothetical protein
MHGILHSYQPVLPSLGATAAEGIERVALITNAQHLIRDVPRKLLCFCRPRLYLFLGIARKVARLGIGSISRWTCSSMWGGQVVTSGLTHERQ